LQKPPNFGTVYAKATFGSWEAFFKKDKDVIELSHTNGRSGRPTNFNVSQYLSMMRRLGKTVKFNSLFIKLTDANPV
ncbi:hypothetical protein PFISCL1PPCAC_20678, partial [Pristionchus fissidentatus]